MLSRRFLSCDIFLGPQHLKINLVASNKQLQKITLRQNLKRCLHGTYCKSPRSFTMYVCKESNE